MQTGFPEVAALLLKCGIAPASVLLHRIVLHPDDAADAILSTADLARGGHALNYQRLQDGLVFGSEALVASFVEDTPGSARQLALRRLVARRPGSVPGDIVYDPDLAHVLHNFISRATAPTFYDAFDADGGEALAGLRVAWPDEPDLLPADDPGLRVITLPHDRGQLP